MFFQNQCVIRKNKQAFRYCSGIASLTIPNSVDSIENGAFFDVRHIVYYGSASDLGVYGHTRWGAMSMSGYVENGMVYLDSAKNTLIAYLER